MTEAIQIPLIGSDHDFSKSNLFTKSSQKGVYDVYECVHCGLQGKRYGLNDYIKVDKDKPCTKQKDAPKEYVFTPYLIQLTQKTMGMDKGYKTLSSPCPIDEREKYGDDVWVFSPKRNEVVRLFSEEYKNITKSLNWFNEKVGQNVLSESLSSGEISELKIEDEVYAKVLFEMQFTGIIFE